MRKLLSFITILFVFSGLAFGGVITVTSPSGGTFCPGDPMTINWKENPRESQQMKIRLWNGTMTAKIMNITATAIPSNGTYNWTIPAGIPQGQYTIMVRSSVDLQIQGFSAVFTINTCTQPQASINVATPANVAPGSNCLINWTSTGDVGSEVRIILFNQFGNSPVQNIVNTTNNDGNYSWPVPGGFQAETYRIKVEKLDGTVSGMSGTFTIGNPGSNNMTLQPLTVNQMSPPDLKVTIVSHPIKPAAHQETIIEFRVENIGKTKSKATVMRGFKATKPINTWAVPALYPGTLFYKQITYTPPGVGWTRFTANADQKWDANQGNNVVSIQLFSIGPDLKITQMHTPNYKRTAWAKCKVRVTVKNIGIVKSGRFDVDCDWHAVGKKRRYKVCKNGLKPGESWTLDFTHRYGTVGMKHAEVFVNKNRKVSEETYENNTAGMTFHISVGNIISAAEPVTYNL